MGDNQARDEENEATDEPSSPSAATNSPSRKRLLADPNPKQGSASASPESSLSSDSLSDRFRKKTRELPNLSDCHGCGLRVNYTNPKERLQTLDSVWRVVLLCTRCIKRAESAEICAYCFAETSEFGCFRCRDCKRCIHEDCAVKYGGYAPWSYCISELGFSVCVDCWVPKLLVNSNMIYRRSRNKNKKKVVVSEPCSLNDSRVSVNSNGPNHKLLEDVVKEANCVVEKKTAVAAKSKENALMKAVVAKSAVELANGALQLVAKKDGKSECFVSGSSSSHTSVVDDAELAIQLHRAMNSSPRISRNSCLINKSCLAVPKTRDLSGNLPARSSDSRGSLNTVSKSNEKIENNVSEPSVCLRASDLGSCIDLGNLIPGVATDTTTSLNGKECQENSGIGLAEVLVGECNSVDDNKMNSEAGSCQKQDITSHGLHSNENRTRGLLKCDGNGNVLHDGRCNGKPDRYLLKYRKRPIRPKAVSHSETKFLCDSFRFDNKASASRLPLKCYKRTKFLCDSFLLKKKASASELPLKCYKRSRKLYSAPFQSCAVDVQAFACASGSSREHPQINSRNTSGLD